MPFRSPNLPKTVLSLVSLLLVASPLFAQETYKPGDRIRFEFMRKEVTGSITEALPADVFKVDVERGDDRFLPPVTLVRKANILGLADASGNEGGTEGGGMETLNHPEAKLRTWVDKTGKYKMEGTFVDLVDDQVTLRKSDGQTLTMPLSKLSDEDAAVARSLKQALLEQAANDDNPFESAARSQAMNNGAERSPQFTIREMDFSQTKVVVARVPPKWSASPEEVEPVDVGQETRTYAIPVSGRRQVVRDIHAPQRLFIGDRNLRERTEQGMVIDLETGDIVGPFTYPMNNVTTIAFDSKTNRLLTATTVGERTRPKTVDVWLIQNGTVEHQFGFVPSREQIVLPVQTGVFLDGDRVLVTVFGKAAIFNLTTMQGEVGVQFTNTSVIHISPNGKHLLGQVDGKTVIFDIATQKAVGSISRPLQINNNFAFNESLTRAAFTEAQRLVVWDLVEDREVEQVVLPVQVCVGTTPIILDDENFLLTRSMSSTLVNTRLKTSIWSYRGPSFEAIPGISKLLAVGDQAGKPSVGFVDMPSQPAQDLIAELTLEELIVMPRGASVSLSNSGLNGESYANLQEQLEANGYRVTAEAPYEFRTSINKGEAMTRTYRDVTGGDDETVTMQSESYELALYHAGEKVWFRSGGSGANDPGMFVQLDEGETVQSRINRGKGTPEGFFKSLLLPDLFVKTPNGYVFGTSKDLDELR